MFFGDLVLKNPIFSAIIIAINKREIRVLRPIFHVEKPFFCCIFTISAWISKIIIDLKLPFEGGYGQLIQSGAWRHYGGVLFHYRSKVGFQMMALSRLFRFFPMG